MKYVILAAPLFLASCSVFDSFFRFLQDIRREPVAVALVATTRRNVEKEGIAAFHVSGDNRALSRWMKTDLALVPEDPALNLAVFLAPDLSALATFHAQPANGVTTVVDNGSECVDADCVISLIDMDRGRTEFSQTDDGLGRLVDATCPSVVPPDAQAFLDTVIAEDIATFGGSLFSEAVLSVVDPIQSADPAIFGVRGANRVRGLGWSDADSFVLRFQREDVVVITYGDPVTSGNGPITELWMRANGEPFIVPVEVLLSLTRHANGVTSDCLTNLPAFNMPKPVREITTRSIPPSSTGFKVDDTDVKNALRPQDDLGYGGLLTQANVLGLFAHTLPQ